MDPQQRSRLKKRYVKELIQRATPAEKKLCRLLSANGIKFSFQRTFDVHYKGENNKKRWDGKFYVADFFLPWCGAIIEVDGSVHYTSQTKDIDRTADLIKKAYKGIHVVLRFSNKDLAFNSGAVIRVILSLIATRGSKTKHNRKQNKEHNIEIARKNEIKALINNDGDCPWPLKKRLLSLANP